MYIQEEPQTLKDVLVEQILILLDGKASKEKFIELAAITSDNPEIHTDKVLLQVSTVLDFLAKQLESESAEDVTPHIIEEACLYILAKLTALPYP